MAATSIAVQIMDNSISVESGAFDAEGMKLVKRAAENDRIDPGRGPAYPPIFRHEIAVIRNCAVLGHVGAVVDTASGALLSQSGAETPNWNRARPRRLECRRLSNGLVTWLDGTRHYFHFFASLLPLLEYLRQDVHTKRPLTVLVPAGGPAFQHQVCKAVAAAYPHVRFEPVGADERAEIDAYLWLHNGCRNSEWLPVARSGADTVANLLHRHYGLARPTGGDLMFFSRGKAKQRRLSNEAELESIAAERGFARFEAHSENHAEQVQRFGNADVIVAVHGAGLTNLIFARPGATLIELFPENCIKSTYLWLARRMGLNYRAVIGSPGDYRQGFHLPPERLRDALDATLEDGSEPPIPRRRLRRVPDAIEPHVGFAR